MLIRAEEQNHLYDTYDDEDYFDESYLYFEAMLTLKIPDEMFNYILQMADEENKSVEEYIIEKTSFGYTD